MRRLAALTLSFVLIGCSEDVKPVPIEVPTPPATDRTAAPANAVPAQPALQAINIPGDGKLENVKVNGVTVPMINIMDGGTVVLVDTDGVKPRSWEEQYKRKGDLPKGYFNLHKTNKNKNDSFEDDEIDQQGRWKMDETGNIVRD